MEVRRRNLVQKQHRIRGAAARKALYLRCDMGITLLHANTPPELETTHKCKHCHEGLSKPKQ